MNEIKYKETILSIAIHREDNNPVFGEGNIIMSINDEGVGPFLSIEVSSDDPVSATIYLDFNELELLHSVGLKLQNQFTNNEEDTHADQ